MAFRNFFKKTVLREEWRLRCLFLKIDVFNGGEGEVLDGILDEEEKGMMERGGDVRFKKCRNVMSFYLGTIDIDIDFQSWVPEIKITGI